MIPSVLPFSLTCFSSASSDDEMRGYMVSTVSEVLTRRMDFTMSLSTVTASSMVLPESVTDVVYTPGLKVPSDASSGIFRVPEVICIIKSTSRMTANTASTQAITSSFSFNTTILVEELIIGSLHYYFVYIMRVRHKYAKYVYIAFYILIR